MVVEYISEKDRDSAGISSEDQKFAGISIKDRSNKSICSLSRLKFYYSTKVLVVNGQHRCCAYKELINLKEMVEWFVLY